MTKKGNLIKMAPAGTPKDLEPRETIFVSNTKNLMTFYMLNRGFYFLNPEACTLVDSVTHDWVGGGVQCVCVCVGGGGGGGGHLSQKHIYAFCLSEIFCLK